MINFNFSIFIFGRLRESCFCLFNREGESVSYFTESIVMCVSKGKGNNFFTGLENGKIFEFKLSGFENFNKESINLNDLNIVMVRSFIAHKKRVSGIYYSNKSE